MTIPTHTGRVSRYYRTRRRPERNLASKSDKSFEGYFLEIIADIARLSESALLLDGELFISLGDRLSFDTLQARLRPAASRIAKLSRECPRSSLCSMRGRSDTTIRDAPHLERRATLERMLKKIIDGMYLLSPASRDRDQAAAWLCASGGALDGMIVSPRKPTDPGNV